MTKRVLLTGATGFVGRQVLKRLHAQGVRVRVIVRAGKRSSIDDLTQADSIVDTHDLFTETTEFFDQACTDIDTVIHVAWYAEPGAYLQSAANLTCLSGTIALASGCIRAGVRRFVGVGSCFEYDLSPGFLSVDTPLNPASPYAATKAAAFLALSECLPANGVELAWCRLFYLYGEGEDKRRLVPYIRERLESGKTAELTSGNQIRDYLDVREAGRMIADIACGSQRGAINICSGIPVTVREMAEQIADEYGRRDLLAFGARESNMVDPPCVVGVR